MNNRASIDISSPPASARTLVGFLSLASLTVIGACLPDAPGTPDASVDILRVGSGPAFVSVGDGVSCMTTIDGSAKCWGLNDHGQLGQANLDDIGDDDLPASIPFVDVGGIVREIHSNGQQTLALLEDGSVRAWGNNDQHELGLMHTLQIGDDESPGATSEADLSLGDPASQLAVGDGFACALLVDGRVRCWGDSDLGQLGRGHTERIGDDEAPAVAGDAHLGQAALQITAGARHACAVLSSGHVRCWGANDRGQLGYGHTLSVGDDESPADSGVLDLGGPVDRVVAGGHHTCALMASGGVRCWGDGLRGQLGHGEAHLVGDDEAAGLEGDVELGGLAVDLAAGWQHTCAVLDGGALRCWGAGDHGQLGLGNTEDIGDDEVPSGVDPIDLGTRQASAVFCGPLSRSTCVRLDDGALRCWGDNPGGQLGGGHTDLLGDEPHEVPGELPNIMVLDDEDDA